MFTIDASVWLNGASPAEAGHAASRAFLDAVTTAAVPVCVPTLLRAEVAGSISRVRKDQALAGWYAASLGRLAFLTEIPLDSVVSTRATALAAAHRLRGADAVYAAVAALRGCVLVSLDNEHLTRLGSAVKVLTPTDALATVPGRTPPN